MAKVEKQGWYYLVNNKTRVYWDNEMWDHTVKRINDAEKKAKNYQDFANKMVTRLKRIKNEEKTYYAICVLHEKGYQEIVDIYDGKLLMDELTKDEDWITNL